MPNSRKNSLHKSPLLTLEDMIVSPIFWEEKDSDDLANATNIYETEKDLVVELAVPGLKAKDVTLMIEDDFLTITGQIETEETEKKKNYYRHDFGHGSFTETIELPVVVAADQASAEITNGMLKVVLPKLPTSAAKIIQAKDHNEKS